MRYARLTRPLVRDGGELREASWDEALDRGAPLAARVRRHREARIRHRDGLRGAAVVHGPPRRGGGNAVRPVGKAVAVVRIDRVGGPVEGEHRLRPLRRAGRRETESAHRRDRGERRREVTCDLAGHARAAGEAGGVDARRVDAVAGLEILDEPGEVGDVARCALRHGRPARERLSGHVPCEAAVERDRTLRVGDDESVRVGGRVLIPASEALRVASEGLR